MPASSSYAWLNETDVRLVSLIIRLPLLRDHVDFTKDERPVESNLIPAGGCVAQGSV